MGSCPNCGSLKYNNCEYCTYVPNQPNYIDTNGNIYTGAWLSPAVEVQNLTRDLGIRFKL